MRVSIVIPTRNNSYLLGQCLSSLASQVKKPDEIIVVDNRSTDNTNKIVEQFKKKGLPILYVQESKISASACRNRGIKVASGQIIALLDSDCVVEKNWLKEIVKAHTTCKDALIQGESKNVINRSGVTSDLRFFWMEQHFFTYLELLKGKKNYIKSKKDFLPINFIDTKNLSFPKNLFISAKFKFDESLMPYEDHDLANQAVRKRISIFYSRNIKVKHLVTRISLKSYLRYRFNVYSSRVKFYRKWNYEQINNFYFNNVFKDETETVKLWKKRGRSLSAQNDKDLLNQICKNKSNIYRQFLLLEIFIEKLLLSLTYLLCKI